MSNDSQNIMEEHMLLELTNVDKKMSYFFADDTDIWDEYGYCSILPPHYNNFVRENKVMKSYNYAGFFDNPKITSYSETGVNENGSNYRANSFGEQIVSWEFKNVFDVGTGTISPNNELIMILLNKNDTVDLRVYTTNQIFTNTFRTGENTTVENGVIELISARAGDGIYWRSDAITDNFTWFGRHQAYIPKVLPQVLLEKTEYPLLDYKISSVQTDTIFRFGGSKETGWWQGYESRITQTVIVLFTIMHNETHL